MTELRRMILIGLLFLIGMLLWHAWQTEHPNNNVSNNINNTDINSPASNVLLAKPVTKKAENIANRYIYIHTKLMSATIDRLGGNIIEARLLKYPVSIQQPAMPIRLLSNNAEDYYLVNSSMTGMSDAIAFQLDQPVVQDNHTQSQTVSLSFKDTNGIKIQKSYVFPENDYLISVKQTVTNQSASDWQGNAVYTIERKPEVAHSNGLFSFNTYTGAVISSPEERYQKLPFKKFAENTLDKTTQNGWMAMTQHYFLSAWIPEPTKNYRYYAKANEIDHIYTIGMQSDVIRLKPTQSVTDSQQLYIGPELSDRLAKIAPGLNLTVDYGILWFIANIIFNVMKKIHAVTGNWGWSIVLVTVIIKILFYKLNAISFRSMAKMRALQPKLEKLREQSGDDRQKLAQGTMALYKHEKVNPMGGCLPLIIQIPVFLSLYWVIIESVELRQAPFILWIQDLSMKDPYYILPLVMGLTIFIQQAFSPKPADPVQQKIMMFMPIVFTGFFFTFPAGLVLYWVVNNSLSILQQWYIINYSLSTGK